MIVIILFGTFLIMSMLDTNFKSSASSILVEKILEQGQRLRNSMVQAILNNDPFNQEILHNTNITTNRNIEKSKSKSLKCTCKTKRPDIDICDGIDKYLLGDNLFLNQELETLETNRSASNVDFLRSASSVNVCHCKNACGICREYETKLISHSASASICSNGDSSIIVTTRQQSIQSKEPQKLNTKKTDENLKLKSRNLKVADDANSYLTKYVDSLKINIYSLKLNNAGQRKVLTYTGTSKYPLTPFSYFIEYSLPEYLTKNIQKIKTRVNSGLNNEKRVRYCTKNVDYDSVYFKQQKIHSVTNIHMLDLNSVDIDFYVSFRSAKQRLALKIGKASFNLGSLVNNRYLSCEQELVLMNEKAPVSLGAVKISVQLGCDKLYFGKEFIDAISCSKENTNLSESDSIHKESSAPIENRDKPKFNKQIAPSYVYKQEQHVAQIQFKETKAVEEETVESNINEEINLLYTLIFISEIQFTSARVDSFIICRGFSREDTVTSKTILNECNPNFNLYQIIPILLDESYVNRFRDNYILVEVWEHQERDQLIGLCKLPVHQFYVAYRNSLIVKYLSRSPHPVISVDWWEPIINPTTNIEVGQLRSIVALGTQSQILSLEQNRNIKSLIKTPKYSESTINIKPLIKTSKSSESTVNKCVNTPYTTAHQSSRTLSINEDSYTVRIEDSQSEQEIKNLDSNNKIALSNDEIVVPAESEPKIIQLFQGHSTVLSSKVDASTQFESKMDLNNTTDNTQLNQRELLSTFLEHLISVRDMPQRNQQVENSTNTEECITNVKNSTVQDYETSTSSCVNNDNQQSTMENITISNETFPNSNSNSNLNVRHTSDLLDSLQKALTLGDNNKNEINKNETNKTNEEADKVSDRFKVHILIESALHLPSRKKCKSKRSKSKNSKQNEEILPSTYVTFKGVSEDINITQVVPKSTSPKWDYRNDIYLPTELLLNNQKRLIFKVWRKANGPNLQPNFQTDIVLGFAALDLTVLISGLPNVQGWFNIVDFTSKCNGQIKIHVNPLENLSKILNYKRSFTPEKLKTDTITVNQAQLSLKCPERQNDARDVCDVPDDLIPSDSLSRALKRKFTELDEITQRLRQRLCAVTNDDFDETNDLFEDEFERDLNTICDDDDFVIDAEPNQRNSNVDMENQPCCSSYQPFEASHLTPPETARSTTTSVMSAINAAKEISLRHDGSTDSIESSDKEQRTNQVDDKLDNHLNEGKLKIDSLLEKLTLLTNDAGESHNKINASFCSRYVSGCSDSNPSVVNVVNTNQSLKDIHNEQSVEPDLTFNPRLFQEIFASSNSLDETRTIQYLSLNNAVHDISSSENSSNVDLQSVSSSSSSNTNISRQAPDGAGHVSNGSQP